MRRRRDSEPLSIAVTPDESLAIVTASNHVDPKDPTKQAPNDDVTVIDLKATPPKVIASLKAGKGAAGISINRAGTLADCLQIACAFSDIDFKTTDEVTARERLAAALVGHVHDAAHAAAECDRDRHERARGVARMIGAREAQIALDVRHPEHFAGARDMAADALAEPQLLHFFLERTFRHVLFGPTS